jgi:hypothetical protein
MIKFFRRIRKNLLSEGKTGKYFKYAIGEIILVVVGILIALSINNWNDERKNRQILNSIYSIISEDLTNDINEIEELLEIKKVWEPILLRIIDGSMTEEDYNNCPDCLQLIFGYAELSIETRGYNLLNSFDYSSKLVEDSLSLKLAQFYTKHLTELHADDQLKQNDLASNINSWKTNYPWGADYISGRNTEGFLDYALNDQDYKSRVASYYLLHYRVDIPNQEAFLTEATSMLDLINKKLN